MLIGYIRVSKKVTERAYRRSCITQKELGSHPELEIP